MTRFVSIWGLAGMLFHTSACVRATDCRQDEARNIYTGAKLAELCDTGSSVGAVLQPSEIPNQRDPWGTPLRLQMEERGATIASAGQDSRFGTDDDITLLCLPNNRVQTDRAKPGR